jgi:3-methylcrotonyl-CoA carboxylase alpha subunit
MSAPVITSVLVANRGEIACRVMRTAKALGLTTVAVHSATDRDARHSREADIRVDLGGSKAADSYLQIDKLIAAAKASGAGHPPMAFCRRTRVRPRDRSGRPDFPRPARRPSTPWAASRPPKP